MSSVCKYFLEGKCRFGSKCRNLHPNRDGGAFNQRDQRVGNRFEVFNSWSGSRGRGRGYGRGQQRYESDYRQPGNRGAENHHSEFNSWSGSRGRGRGYGRGQQRYESDYRQTGNRGYGSVQRRDSEDSYSTEELAQMIREDMEIWAESHMWPFSCYSCQREGSCLPGLSDVSPEELRWQAYQAKMGSGGEAEYLEILRKLNDEVLSVRGELMRVRASNVGTLLSSNLPPGGSQTLFGAASSSSKPFSSLQNTLPPSGSQTLFGAASSSSSQNTLFNLQGGGTTTLFSAPPSSTSSLNPLFATPQNSLFTNPQTNSPQATFGGSSKGGLFGALPTTNPTQLKNLGSSQFSPVLATNPTSDTSAAPSVTSIQQLTQDELKAFKADNFILGQIPETPPPPELI